MEKVQRTQCTWHLWCNTKTERKALKIADSVIGALRIAPIGLTNEYDVDFDGISVTFRSVSEASWADEIVATIGRLQTSGRRLMFDSDVFLNPSFTATDPRVPGMLQLSADLRDLKNASSW